MPFEHLEAVLAETAALAGRFTVAGHRLYLVGGIVRDLWLGVPVGDTVDIDLTTEATPDQIKAIVGPWADAVWLQGERFGTIGLQSGDRSFEITTHRGEVYGSDSRKPDVVFGDDVRVDLSRRDFTINAMAIRIDGGSRTEAAGELVDPFEGVADLRGQVLRTPLDPRVSFSDDPLRILRAARFMARFGLVADADLVVAAKELAHRLDIVAAERSRDELEKLLGGPGINTGLRFLTETGALEQVMPWFAGASELQAVSVAQAGALPAPWWLRLSPLLMAGVTSQDKRDEVVAERARLVKCSTATSRAVLTAAKATWAGERLEIDATTVAPVRAWLQATTPYSEEAIVLAEMAGHRKLAEAARSLIATDDAWCADLPVDGGALIQAFDLEPGPMVGQLLRAVQEAQFSEGVLTRDRALAVASAALAGLVGDHAADPEGG